eukprot:5694881-Amphidinium_carterae.1
MAAIAIHSLASNDIPTDWGTLLTSFPARCRKTNGTVVMTPCRLVFTATDAGASKNLAVDLDQVQKYDVSKPHAGDDRALIQLVLPSDKVVVELISPEHRWAHQRELVDWIKCREERVAKLRRDEDSIGPRMKAVFRDAVLKEKYLHIVEKTNLLTMLEFLELHARDIAAAEPLPEAPIVDLNALTICGAVARRASGKEVDHSAGGAGVDEEEARAIFREMPAIQQLYNSEVPATLTSTKFWERCLRSRYFLETTGQPIPALQRPDPLFDSLAKEPPKTVPPSAQEIEAAVDVDADLISD